MAGRSAGALRDFAMTINHARELRKNATDCERLLWQYLRAHRLQGFKFKRQQPLGVYIVDFVCFEARLIVEADGGHHAEQAEYDNRRDEWLRSQGFTVLRFWNNEIMGNIEGVLERILAVCEANAPSPQPLSHQGRGAKADAAGRQNANPVKTEAQNSPLPLRERGRGRGGEG
jgi:very-short-patch-repair endonuclease